jgi:hypothetical protein
MLPKVRRAYFSLFINVFCVRIFNAADKKEFIKAPLYYSLAVALSDVIPNSLDYVCFLCGARLRRTPHRKEIRGGGFAAPATPPWVSVQPNVVSKGIVAGGFSGERENKTRGGT